MKDNYFNTIQQFNDYNGCETLNPLVSVVHVDSTDHITETLDHYVGTLVKTETGRTAKDLINDRIMGKAKELLASDTLSVTQVSQRLGFEYPQHFVRFFKALTGKTPTQWRAA